MSINKIYHNGEMNMRISTDEMERLVLQSVRESDLFRSEWERLFVSTVLQMYLDKGEFSHFMEIHPFDRIDLEWYFRDSIIDRYGKEGYKYIIDNTFTEEDYKEEDYGDE